MEKPKIRFKGYQEDWEQRKVSELCSISTGKSNTQDKVEDGEYPFYVRSPIIERSTKYLYDEEAVITVGDGVGTGKVFHYVNGKYDLHQRCYRMYGFSDELNAHYFYHTFSKLFYKRVMAMTAKTSVDSVRLEMISDMKIPVPNVEEQRKIGNLLDGIDHLITLHQRKCEEMKTLKKYMLQKMFPQNGQLVPQIRFSGFTEDWEQRKLGDVADVTKLAGFEFTEHVVYSDEGNIIALRGLNIKNGQLILDDVKYIDGSNFSKLSRSKLFIDDIMFTYVGTVGEVAIIKENDRFYLAPNVSRIRVKSDDSPKFISHYMRTDNFKNKIIFPLIATSSQPALSMENIRKFTINIPINKEEQDCLAKYFDSLDHLITLHQQKCDELRNIKKFMLQNMFI